MTGLKVYIYVIEKKNNYNNCSLALFVFQNFNKVYFKYVQILNNFKDVYIELPKQSHVEHCFKGLVEKYHVQGFPLEAKEFEMRVYEFINHSNINNQSKVMYFFYNNIRYKVKLKLQVYKRIMNY